MSLFLSIESKTIDYSCLFADIRNSTKYIPCFRTADLYCYFLNLLNAITRNKDIVLLDSDLSEDEIANLNISNLNEQVDCDCLQINSFTELKDAILSSSSNVTLFTSGTTGQPKKVVHTIHTLTRSVRFKEGNSEHVWGFAFNPTHMAGLQVFFQSVLNNSALVNLFGLQRREIIDTIQKYNVSHISATPTFYRMLRPVDFCISSVVRITLGGEKSDQKLINDLVQIFPSAKINNIYASTEAGSIFAAKGEYFYIPEHLKNHIRVENNEILIHNSMLGKSDSLTIQDDFYHTNDLIEWKDDSHTLFRFASRKNELLNVGGYKVNPNEIEEVINMIDGVCQSLVYGKKNSVLGTILCADVKLNLESNENNLLSESDIRLILKAKLQDYKIPRKIKFVKELSVTRTGKLKRN